MTAKDRLPRMQFLRGKTGTGIIEGSRKQGAVGVGVGLGETRRAGEKQ
jgi:hypothetical protein